MLGLRSFISCDIRWKRELCIERHHEMNDVLWHDIDKYLINVLMCYTIMFVLSTKLWNLGNVRLKKYYFFKVNGDLSNPFRELSNGMKFEVCCFDSYAKCVVSSY